MASKKKEKGGGRLISEWPSLDTHKDILLSLKFSQVTTFLLQLYFSQVLNSGEQLVFSRWKYKFHWEEKNYKKLLIFFFNIFEFFLYWIFLLLLFISRQFTVVISGLGMDGKVSRVRYRARYGANNHVIYTCVHLYLKCFTFLLLCLLNIPCIVFCLLGLINWFQNSPQTLPTITIFYIEICPSCEIFDNMQNS